MAYSTQLIFAATLAQFNTAMGTTLPAYGGIVMQAPIQASGILLTGATFTFTGTTTIGTGITGISSLVGLYVGLPISSPNSTGSPKIATIGPGSVATVSGGAFTSASAETFTASPNVGQIDFSYDGANFLRFFGANPAPPPTDHYTGVSVNELTPDFISFLTSIFAATLGAPVPPNLAVPPPFVP